MQDPSKNPSFLANNTSSSSFQFVDTDDRVRSRRVLINHKPYKALNSNILNELQSQISVRMIKSSHSKVNSPRNSSSFENIKSHRSALSQHPQALTSSENSEDINTIIDLHRKRNANQRGHPLNPKQIRHPKVQATASEKPRNSDFNLSFLFGTAEAAKAVRKSSTESLVTNRVKAVQIKAAVKRPSIVPKLKLNLPSKGHLTPTRKSVDQKPLNFSDTESSDSLDLFIEKKQTSGFLTSAKQTSGYLTSTRQPHHVKIVDFTTNRGDSTAKTDKTRDQTLRVRTLQEAQKAKDEEKIREEKARQIREEEINRIREEEIKRVREEEIERIRQEELAKIRDEEARIRQEDMERLRNEELERIRREELERQRVNEIERAMHAQMEETRKQEELIKTMKEQLEKAKNEEIEKELNENTQIVPAKQYSLDESVNARIQFVVSKDDDTQLSLDQPTKSASMSRRNAKADIMQDLRKNLPTSLKDEGKTYKYLVDIESIDNRKDQVRKIFDEKTKEFINELEEKYKANIEILKKQLATINESRFFELSMAKEELRLKFAEENQKIALEYQAKVKAAEAKYQTSQNQLEEHKELHEQMLSDYGKQISHLEKRLCDSISLEDAQRKMKHSLIKGRGCEIITRVVSREMPIQAYFDIFRIYTCNALIKETVAREKNRNKGINSICLHVTQFFNRQLGSVLRTWRYILCQSDLDAQYARQNEKFYFLIQFLHSFGFAERALRYRRLYWGVSAFKSLVSDALLESFNASQNRRLNCKSVPLSTYTPLNYPLVHDTYPVPRVSPKYYSKQSPINGDSSLFNFLDQEYKVGFPLTRNKKSPE